MSLFQKKKPEPPQEDRYDALLAEFQNYRCRTANVQDQAAQAAARKTALAFLPLYDDFQRALAQPCQDAAYARGVELMMQKLLSILADLNIQPMSSLGRCFNPTYHEAVEHITDPKYRPEVIVQVLQTGFTMDEEVLRHAKVVVANCQ